VTVVVSLQRVGDVALHACGFGDGGKPQLPQSAVGRCGHQRVEVFDGQRLETDSPPLEADGLDVDHVVTNQARRRQR
jgi:hypothetical protein